MDWLQLFGVRVIHIDAAKLLPPLSFPGNYEVCVILGGDLELDPVEAVKWSNVQRDVFVCAEEALDALGHISKLIPASLTVAALYDASNGHARRVQLGAEADFRTFVPLTLLLGKILQFSHTLDIPSKLRISNFVTFALQKALGLHPKVGNASVIMAAGGSGSSAGAASSASRAAGGGGVHSTTLHGGTSTEPGDDEVLQPPFERFHELGVTPEEFEASQAPKYAEAYARMRTYVPPNITKSSLKNLLHDGVPRPLAKHVWETKILWLLCMHPQDLPKIHIADLRGKYQFHSLDIVEMRALHFWLPKWKGDSAKAEWRTSFKSRLDKLVGVEIFGDGRPVGQVRGQAQGGDGGGEGEDERQSLEMRNACDAEAEEEGYYDPSEPLRRIYLHREKADKKDGKEYRNSPSHVDASDSEGQGDLHYSNVALADSSPKDRAGASREKRRPERHDRDGKDGKDGHRDRRSHTHSHHSKLEANLALLDSLSSSSASSAHGPAAESEYDSLTPRAHRSKSRSISLPLTSADFASTLLQDDEVAAFAEDGDEAGMTAAKTATNTARNADAAAAGASMLPSQLPARQGAPKLTKRLSFKQRSHDGDAQGDPISPSSQHKMDLWSDSIDASSSSSSSPEGPVGPVVSRAGRGASPRLHDPSVRHDGTGGLNSLNSLNSLDSINGINGIKSLGGNPDTPAGADTGPSLALSAMSTLGSPGSPGSPGSQSSGLGYANGAGPLQYRSHLSPATGPNADASHDEALSARMDSDSADEHHRHLVYQTYQTEFHDLSCSSSDSGESVNFCDGDADGPHATPNRPAQRRVAPISQWMQSFLSPAGAPPASPEADWSVGLEPSPSPNGHSDRHGPSSRESAASAASAATDASNSSVQFLGLDGHGSPRAQSRPAAAPVPVSRGHFSADLVELPSVPRVEAASTPGHSSAARRDRQPTTAAPAVSASASASTGGGGPMVLPSNEYASSQKRPSWYTQGVPPSEGRRQQQQEDDDDASEEGVDSEFRDVEYSSDTSTYTASETATSDEDDEDEDESDSQDGSEGSGYDDDEEEGDEEEYDDDGGDARSDRSDEAYEEYLLENGSYLGLAPRGSRARRRPGSSHTGTSTTGSLGEQDGPAASSGRDSQFTSEMFAALASVFGDSEAEARMTIKPRGGPGRDAPRSRRGSGMAGVDAGAGLGDGGGEGPLGAVGAGPNQGLAASPARQPSAGVETGCKSPSAGPHSPFWSNVWSILREPGEAGDEARRRGLTPEELRCEKEMEDEIDLYVPVELGAEWEDCTNSSNGSAGCDDDDDDDDEDQDALSADGSVGDGGDFAWRVSDDEDGAASRPASALGQAPTSSSHAPVPAPHETSAGDASKQVSAPPHQHQRQQESAAADEVPAQEAGEGGSARAFSTLAWEEGDWTSAGETTASAAGQTWEEGEWTSAGGDGEAAEVATAGADGLESAGLDEALGDLPLEEIVMYGDVRHVRSILFPASGPAQPGVARPHMSAAQATALLQRCSEQTDELLEPLETFMLLVDDLHADVNAVNADTGAAPLHSVFSNLLLGRFLVSRGADVLLRDGNGDSPLSLCIEYDYEYLLPAFVASGGESRLIESRDEAKLLQYASTLLGGGYGVKVSELCDEGHVKISADAALELLESCRRGGFEAMREPVETFELLERLVLEG